MLEIAAGLLGKAQAAIFGSRLDLVSERLQVSQQRVQALIKSGKLPAEKVGRDWLIDEKDLEIVKDRPTGRPPKVKNENVKK